MDNVDPANTLDTGYTVYGGYWIQRVLWILDTADTVDTGFNVYSGYWIQLYSVLRNVSFTVRKIQRVIHTISLGQFLLANHS